MQPSRLGCVAVVAAAFHSWPRTTDRERLPRLAQAWKPRTAEALRAEAVGFERNIRPAQGLLRLPIASRGPSVVWENAPSRVVYGIVVQEMSMDSRIDLKGIRALALPAIVSTVPTGNAAIDDSIGAEGQVVIRPWRLKNVELTAGSVEARDVMVVHKFVAL